MHFIGDFMNKLLCGDCNGAKNKALRDEFVLLAVLILSRAAKTQGSTGSHADASGVHCSFEASVLPLLSLSLSVCLCVNYAPFLSSFFVLHINL